MLTYSHISVALARDAWIAYERGNCEEAKRLAGHAIGLAVGEPRRERQQVEVVALAIAGERCRACDLASEHLCEFPYDVLARRVQRACRAT